MLEGLFSTAMFRQLDRWIGRETAPAVVKTGVKVRMEGEVNAISRETVAQALERKAAQKPVVDYDALTKAMLADPRVSDVRGQVPAGLDGDALHAALSTMGDARVHPTRRGEIGVDFTLSHPDFKGTVKAYFDPSASYSAAQKDGAFYVETFVHEPGRDTGAMLLLGSHGGNLLDAVRRALRRSQQQAIATGDTTLANTIVTTLGLMR